MNAVKRRFLDDLNRNWMYRHSQCCFVVGFGQWVLEWSEDPVISVIMILDIDQLRESMELVDCGEFYCVGLSVPITSSYKQNFEIISKLWPVFNRERHRIENRGVKHFKWEKYGITYKVKSDYLYLSGIRWHEQMTIPSSMVRKIIPAGRFVRFIHRGGMRNLKQTLNAIYGKILPEVRRDSMGDTYGGVIYYERYDERFNWNDPKSVVELFIRLS